MKNIYIDCGTNLGQGFELLKKDNIIQDSWEIHMFEPNPICYKKLIEKYSGKDNFHLHNEAVWNKNEKKLFTTEFCPTLQQWAGGAGNIMGENFIKPNYILDEYIKKNNQLVSCINFSTFLSGFSQEDNIIIKMDIEGAEFAVLDLLIKDNQLPKIKKIYIEWHEHMLKNVENNQWHYKHKFRESGVQFFEWQ